MPATIIRADILNLKMRMTFLVPISITTLAGNWQKAMNSLYNEILAYYPAATPLLRAATEETFSQSLARSKDYVICLLVARIVSVLSKEAPLLYNALPEKVRTLYKMIDYDQRLDIMTHSLLQNLGHFDDTSPNFWINFIPTINIAEKPQGKSLDQFYESLCNYTAASAAAFRNVAYALQCLGFSTNLLANKQIAGTPWYLLFSRTEAEPGLQRAISGRFSPVVVSDVDLALFQLFGGYLKYVEPTEAEVLCSDSSSIVLTRADHAMPMLPTVIYTFHMTDDIALAALGLSLDRFRIQPTPM